MAIEELNSIVVSKTVYSPGLASFRIQPIGWDIAPFEPGQYCAVGLPPSNERHPESQDEDKKVPSNKLIKRAYSIASGGNQTDYLELYVTMVNSGSLTPRAFNLEVGDKIWVSPKIVGHFTLDGVGEEDNVVLISTGTGLAPYISMLRTDLLKKTKGNVAILNGVRHSYDLGYRSELELVDQLTHRFSYWPIISRPKGEVVDWVGEVGYVQSIWEQRKLETLWGKKLTPDNTHVFLCGNPSMIETMQKLLHQEGYADHSKQKPGQIHFEKYW